MSSDKERAKRLTDKQQAILDIVITSIEALVVVVCIVISVIVWVGASDPMNRSINWFAIQTDSMMGTNDDSLNPGDLMFTKSVKSIKDLKVGDVIAFKGTVNDVPDQIITHRIVEIDNLGQIWTQGDNAPKRDFLAKRIEDVIGVYTGKIKGLGKMMLWLGGYKWTVYDEGIYNDPNRSGGYYYIRSGKSTAFLVIIIPLALLFIYNGYVVVKWTMDERAKKIRAAALAEAEQSTQSQEDLKRAALSDYMRANGMSDEQIAAYFAEQDAKAAAVAESVADEQAESVDVAAEQPVAEDATAAETPDDDTPKD